MVNKLISFGLYREAFSVLFVTNLMCLMQSYFGANVLYPRTIIPVMQYDIPIVIRNIFNLSAPGTKNCRAPIIEAEVKHDSVAYLKGFGTIDNLALVNVEGTGMAGVPGTASAIFAAVKDVGGNVIMISQQ
ncbi:putative homoserine dehydrogenase [Helianthus anomalus]